MTNEELCYLSAVDLAAAVRAKLVSPVEVAEAVLERIERLQPVINCFSAAMADEARAAAKEAEAAVLRGDEPGPLCGVPVTIKDILAVKDSRTTMGSKLFESNVTREDAPAVERLRKAGAVFIGRTTTPEFGWKGVTDSPLFGITRNPWNLELTPGGSSGGASAAVAAGMGPIGIGTDGGGSIRIPAAFCGLVGHKASFGRVPNFPATPVDSLRHTGPLTRTVADAALALDVMSGPDERDPASLPADNISYLAGLDDGIAGLRIAYSPDLGYAQVAPEVAQLCEQAAMQFAEAGAVVERIDLGWQDPYDCWNTFFYGGIAAAHCHRPAEELELLDPGLQPVVEKGAKLSAVDVVKASMVRNAFWQRVRRVYDEFDLLVTPSLAVPPFPVGQNNVHVVARSPDRATSPTAGLPAGEPSETSGPVGVRGRETRAQHGTSGPAGVRGRETRAQHGRETRAQHDPLPDQEPRHLRWTAFTYPFNLTGQPACSVPCGWTESNLPVGLQLVGRRFDDATVLRAARALEQIAPWSDRRPVLPGFVSG